MNIEEKLIDKYKQDFLDKTGKGLKCIIGTFRQGSTNFITTKKINFYSALDIILEYTNWDYNKIIGSKRTEDLVLSRAIVNYIMVNNGYTITSLGYRMSRDHSTIINSIRSFENTLETDYYTQKLFNEILNNLKEIYNKDIVMTKEEFNIKYLR